jgi:hypothetical protein
MDQNAVIARVCQQRPARTPASAFQLPDASGNEVQQDIGIRDYLPGLYYKSGVHSFRLSLAVIKVLALSVREMGQFALARSVASTKSQYAVCQPTPILRKCAGNSLELWAGFQAQSRRANTTRRFRYGSAALSFHRPTLRGGYVDEHVHRPFAEFLAGFDVRELLTRHVHRQERIEIDISIHADGVGCFLGDGGRVARQAGHGQGGSREAADKSPTNGFQCV